MFYTFSKNINKNLYIITEDILRRCLTSLWNTDFLSNLFDNYTDKASLIYSIIRYPFSLLKVDGNNQAISYPGNISSANFVNKIIIALIIYVNNTYE